MSSGSTLSRRGFLGGLAALGSISLAACATNSTKASRLRAASRATGQLPPRGEFVVRNAYVLTMDPKLGNIPRGDVHVRNGMLVAVGPNLAAPDAEEIDGSNRIALPGFIDTHFHLWGSFARGIVADGDFDYFPVMSRIGPAMTPEDAYNSSKLGIAEALNSGLTTIHDWAHNIITGAYADADLRALRDVGIRARFSYGYSRNLQLKPEQTADLADIARVKREWFSSSNDGLLTMGFASRGPGDTPPQVYRREWENVRSLGLPITQHAGRSLQEIAKFHRIEMLYRDKLLGPDVQLIHTLNTAPFINPAILLVQQAQPANVDTVVIDGRILKHEGKLTALDAEEVIRKAAESFTAVRKRAGGPY